MILNTGQMCTLNYSGRNVRFKVPRLDKKCVVDIVYYKNKTSENIRRIKRQLFLFYTVMYRHFLNLISQDFWCPHLFVRPKQNTRGYQKVLSLTWKEPEIWIYSALFFNVVPFQLHTLVPSSFPVINTRSVEVNILVP